MSAPFELRLMASKNSAPDETAALIHQVFDNANGQKLLALLCEAANPLEHFSTLTAHEHGQKEVTATLWRYGAAATITLPPATTQKDNGYHIERRT